MAANISVEAGPHPLSHEAASIHTPAYQAYQILHVAFVVAPLAAGADKFFNALVNWEQYLSPLVTRMLPGSVTGHTFMLAVGLIEMVAALIVAFRPAIGGWI